MSEQIPKRWLLKSIGEMISESRLELINEDSTKRLSVSLHLKGVGKRSERATDQIGVTRYFMRKAGQFIYGKQNLHKGALGIIPKMFEGFSSSQDIPAFDFNAEINPDWFLQYFRQQHFYEGLEKIASGTGSKRIQPKDLYREIILTPPLLEQKKIAFILNSVDEVIDNTQKQIDKLQDLKKGTLNELLTNGIGHSEFKDSELGEIPKSWEVKRLEEVCSKLKPGPFGTSITKSMYVEKGYKVYGQEQVISGDAFFGNYFIDKNKYIELSAFSVQADDVLISLVGTIGKCLIIPKGHEMGIINPRLILMRLNKLCTSKFLQYLLSSKTVQEQLRQTQQGGTMGVLSASVLKPLKLRIPPISEQENLTKIFGSIDDRIINLNSKLSQIQYLKKSLMQDLLTGEVRVQVS